MTFYYGKIPLWLTLAVSFTIFTFLVALGVSVAELKNEGGQSHPLLLLKRLFHLDSRLGINFFHQVIPGLDRYKTEDDPDLFLQVDAIDLFLDLLVDIRYQSPQELLRVQIPLMSSLQTQKGYVTTAMKTQTNPTVAETALMRKEVQRETPKTDYTRPKPKTETGRNPKVLILHTHTSESYIPASGEEHCFNGRGDIVKIGAHLAGVLTEKYEIPALHCNKIHDHYPFRECYQRSEKTVKEYLSRYPEIELVLDIHRDATPGINHKTNLNGKTAAKLIVVVGTDKMGLSHPNWKKNHQFAMELVAAADRIYPNLMHGIILSDARYNQHLHERALIIEVGDHHSTLGEALYSAELLAEVLASYLKSSSLRSFSL